MNPCDLVKAWYGYIKVLKFDDQLYTYVVGGYKIAATSMVEAIARAIALHYIFNVDYPPQASSFYRYIAALFDAKIPVKCNAKAKELLQKYDVK